MTYVTIERDGPIATVRFDSGTAANALSFDLIAELTDAARRFETDTQTAAVVLAGRADTFCLGFDLNAAQAAALSEDDLAERRATMAAGKRMCAAWEAVAPLTISAMEGWCVGGGVALAVATDLRVMSESGGLYVPELERGLNMSWGSIPRIVNLVGPARAKRLVLLAERLDAGTSVAWGIADEAAPAGETVSRALILAQRAAEIPRAAFQMTKQAIDAYAGALAHLATHADQDQFALALSSSDAQDAITAFLNKRQDR